ncbi:LysR family transcriptional regulator [Nitratireductor kimnyeongensis]|uniref:LysR family transcriptional regulator n=1 Tax=Nitratireductor kimnyeongensis TaxID=430679 RepID=A0ABW0T732_9HYPH|nr:LysR family transcriptional regulator [Nitratireductor kimnyeongensis]QZZ34086.1 LysR family transcriptional regulator [Nitratireductor kimnyeongensis]
MDRQDLSALVVLNAVAEAGSFTRASRQLNRAQSGVSQTIRELEARLGVALLARTTRSVRLTEAGRRLLDDVAPALMQISNSLTRAKTGATEPAGTLRITTLEHPAQTILVPAIAELQQRYPAIEVDLHVSDRLTDIVDGGFDAGVRFAGHLEKDMTAIPISADIRATVVGAPRYFERHGKPCELEDLRRHDCINYRLATHGVRYRWLFQKSGRPIEVAVSGTLTVNGTAVLLEAARRGIGLGYVFEPLAAADLSAGTLETCLESYAPSWSRYHLYYPDRRQKSPALKAFMEVLQGRGRAAGEKPSVF